MINVYTADSLHSSAHFNLDNLVIPDVAGDFAKLSGKFIYDPDNLDKSSIEAFIDVKSITTGNKDRDAQLLSEDFFNVSKYPIIKFYSKKIEIFDEDVLKVCGDLTVKGITKEVVLNVERPQNEKDASLNLTASTLVNREEFGLELGPLLEAGEMLVGNNIQMTMDIQLLKE